MEDHVQDAKTHLRHTAFGCSSRSCERLIGGKAMGKGDLRTKRGKIYRGTHGKTRPGRKKSKGEKKA